MRTKAISIAAITVLLLSTGCSGDKEVETADTSINDSSSSTQTSATDTDTPPTDTAVTDTEVGETDTAVQPTDTHLVTETPTTTDPPTTDPAEALYDQHCSGCHASVSVLAAFVQTHTEQQIADKMIGTGSYGHAGGAPVSTEEADLLAAWMKGLYP